MEDLITTSLPSVINNPFQKKMITQIYISISQNLFDENFSAYGTVKFKNGNTGGEQKFTGHSFDDVVMQIKEMINSFNQEIQ